MKQNIREYLGWIIAVLTIIGSVMIVGQYKEKIDRLEESDKHYAELWEQQIAINSELKTIVTMLAE